MPHRIGFPCYCAAFAIATLRAFRTAYHAATIAPLRSSADRRTLGRVLSAVVVLFNLPVEPTHLLAKNQTTNLKTFPRYPHKNFLKTFM